MAIGCCWYPSYIYNCSVHSVEDFTWECWQHKSYLYICIYIYIHIYIYIYIYLYNSAPVALSTHSGDISCSLVINPSHTDESSERRWTLLVYFRNRHLKIFLHVSPGCPLLITDQIYGKTASLIVFRHIFYHNLDYGAYFQFNSHDLFEKVDWN